MFDDRVELLQQHACLPWPSEVYCNVDVRTAIRKAWLHGHYSEVIQHLAVFLKNSTELFCNVKNVTRKHEVHV